MSLQSDFPDRLVQLCDGRPGLRGGIHVTVHSPPPDPQPSTLNSQPILDFIASDETLDRYHEVISAAGWKLDNYRLNPVFQNAHQYGDIIFTLGKALITEIRSAPPSTPNSQPSTFLYQRIQFATDANPIARIAYALYKGTFLNAVSVGFVPLRWRDSDGTEHSARGLSTPQQRAPAPLANHDTPPATQHLPLSAYSAYSAVGSSAHPSIIPSFQRSSPPPLRTFLEQELLEVSAVAIPANPNALALAYKSGALEKSDLRETLDLLRCLCDSRFEVRGSRFKVPAPAAPQPSTLNLQPLIALARELREIMKHL